MLAGQSSSKKVRFSDSTIGGGESSRSHTYGTVPRVNVSDFSEPDMENITGGGSRSKTERNVEQGSSISNIARVASLIFTVVIVGFIASTTSFRPMESSNSETVDSITATQTQSKSTIDFPSELSPTSSSSLSSITATATDASATAAGAGQTTDRRPNFVFVLVDDLEWNAFGYTNPEYAPISPTFQTLMREGIYFNRYYAQELCNPARSALLTGRYPSTIGTQTNSVQITTEDGLAMSEILLPQVLRDGGNYKSYMLGKWHLGHYMPEYLPTSRGFDEFLGYMAGGETYWSKVAMPGQYLDFMYADSQCYNRQQNENWNDYSTLFYQHKAVDAILKHDYDAQPMFFYFASQAVHNPFGDSIYNQYADGMNSSFVGEEMADYIDQHVVGELRKQMFMALNMLDTAVGDIVDALTQVNQLDNTYIIVSSDNGGCYFNGGRDGPLRGTKASLWEGGTKVDSFIFSPLLPQSAHGTRYNGISHITDWFPTIVELAGIDYVPDASNAFDGVSQAKAMLGEEDNQREYVLYNVYTGSVDADVNTNANGAIRNDRYKLMHVYTGNTYDLIYDEDVAEADVDDQISSDGDCGIDSSTEGEFTYLLFDIDSDISESNNLYNDPEVADVQAELTAKLEYYADKAIFSSAAAGSETQDQIFAFWDANQGFVQPWKRNNDLSVSSPSLCEKETIFHRWDPTGLYEVRPLLDKDGN